MRFLILSLWILSSCSTSVQNAKTFWISPLPPELSEALARFEKREVLSGGLIYGNVARTLKPKEWRLSTIESALHGQQCEKIESTVKDIPSKKDKLCHGKTIRQVIYRCPDASMIRVKPNPDDCNQYRPFPHLVKSVRFQETSDVFDFDQEAFKVDADGNAQPPSQRQVKSPELMKDWGDRTHFPLTQ